MLKLILGSGTMALMLIALPGWADTTSIPDLSHSVATIAYGGPGTPSLLVVPDGNGNPFTAAHDEDGNAVDATITLTLLDIFDVPIANYPCEDLWLESADGGLVSCIGGSNADYDTDANGQTQWVNPLRAAGSSEAPVLVMISGAALDNNPGLPLNFNSPDLNADGIVNLIDVAIASQDYYAGYSFRCDWNGDGLLDLRDVPILAVHMGAQCP
jgi:hypothetical protein